MVTDCQKPLKELLPAKGKPAKFEHLKKMFLMAQTNINLYHILPTNNLKK